MAEYAGVVKSTVSYAVAELMEMGIIEEESGFKKRKRLRLAEDYRSVVGVYMGLTSLHISRCDLKANIIDSFECSIDFTIQTPEEISGIIIKAIEAFEAEDIIGIGVGLPGPVDFSNQVLYTPPEMPGWDGYPFYDILKEKFSCIVVLDNDVNVLALGERDKGLAEGCQDFLYVKVGTGIGSGLMVNGGLFRGADGAAGDIGHIAVDSSDILCPCGNRGCLEMAAGSRAIADEANQRKGESPFLLSLEHPICAEDVGEGMSRGCPVCTQIIIRSGQTIGTVLAKFVNFFNPKIIIVGGGVAQSGQKFISSIQEILYKRSTPLATAKLAVRKSELQEQAGTMGAAILVIDEIFKVIKGNPLLTSKKSNIN